MHTHTYIASGGSEGGGGACVVGPPPPPPVPELPCCDASGWLLGAEGLRGKKSLNDGG